MKFSELFRRNKNEGRDDHDNEQKADSQNPESENQEEEITSHTKIKVVAALLIAGFATYVAWWVQEPTNIQADVLGTTMEALATTEFAETVATAETTANQVEVAILDFAFNPAEVKVEKGMTVKWTNQDSVPHTVTGSTFTSGTLNSGESFNHTFDSNGTFEYRCSFHPQMKGTVTVGAVSAVETAALPADELLPAADSAPEFTLDEFDSESDIVSAAVGGSVITFPGDDSSITMDAQQFLAESEQAEAQSATELAKSGPEDMLYVGLFMAILYLNRRKLASALR